MLPCIVIPEKLVGKLSQIRIVRTIIHLVGMVNSKLLSKLWNIHVSTCSIDAAIPSHEHGSTNHRHI